MKTMYIMVNGFFVIMKMNNVANPQMVVCVWFMIQSISQSVTR